MRRFITLLAVVAHAAAWPLPARTARAASGTARFVALTPVRVLDTRSALGWPGGALGFGGSLTLPVVGRGVPTSATAVALNLTVTEPAGAGFVTAWPSGTARPDVSNLNVNSAAETVSNFVVVALGSGRVDIYSSTRAHVVADVVGYFIPVSLSAAGRFERVEPRRVVDTRVDGSGALVAGEQRLVPVAARAGVPADARAVVATVTAADPASAGYVTVWPAGPPLPATSTVNVAGPRASTANLAFVGLGAGAIQISVSMATHVVIDVVGYITGDSAPTSDRGLFVPLPPARLVDTRAGSPIGRLAALRRSDVSVAGVGPLPATGVGAVLVNLTATRTLGGTYVTAYPARTDVPPTSNVNVANGETVAGAAVVALGDGGRASLVSLDSSDVVVDVFGYFVGTPVAPDPLVPPDPPGSLGGSNADPIVPRITVVYALPSDAVVEPAIPEGVRHELGIVNGWFGAQTGGRYLRFRNTEGVIDVSVASLSMASADLSARADPLATIVRDLTATRQLPIGQPALVYVPISATACGATGAGVVVVFMAQCAGTPRTDSSAWTHGALFVTAHELGHLLGAVPECGTHFDGAGHVNDDPRDLMYVGPRARDYAELTLDPGRDDYFAHGRSDCADIAANPLWG